jgi:hypothetical protein
MEGSPARVVFLVFGTVRYVTVKVPVALDLCDLARIIDLVE